MGETLLSFLVQVRNGDARSKDSIVGVLGGQVGGSLRSKVLQEVRDEWREEKWRLTSSSTVVTP